MGWCIKEAQYERASIDEVEEALSRLLIRPTARALADGFNISRRRKPSTNTRYVGGTGSSMRFWTGWMFPPAEMHSGVPQTRLRSMIWPLGEPEL